MHGLATSFEGVDVCSLEVLSLRFVVGAALCTKPHRASIVGTTKITLEIFLHSGDTSCPIILSMQRKAESEMMNGRVCWVTPYKSRIHRRIAGIVVFIVAFANVPPSGIATIDAAFRLLSTVELSLIHISEPTRPY